MLRFCCALFAVMASVAASAASLQGEPIAAHSTWGAAVSSSFDVASTKSESNTRIGKFIADAAKISIAASGRFSIALSGGSQPEV